MFAYCFIAEKEGDPITVRDAFRWDVKTLQPQPGPVLAEWIRKWRGWYVFKIHFDN